MQPPAPEDRVILGRVVKVRGLRGDVKIVPSTWNLDRFRELDRLWCTRKDGETILLTITTSGQDGRFVYLRFAEAPGRAEAETLLGGELFVDSDKRAPLPDDSHYYHDDVVGCQVIDKTLGPIGKVTEVLGLGFQDVFQVQGPYGEVLVPVIADVIVTLAIDQKQITVDLPEGLIDLKDDATAQPSSASGQVDS